MNLKFLLTASAIPLAWLSTPALAQHSGSMSGMTMPGMTMPAPKPAAKKPAVKKKAAKKTAPAKHAATPRPSAKTAASRPSPADPTQVAAPPGEAVDHSVMDHGAMVMPEEPVATPAPDAPAAVDHSHMDHSPPVGGGAEQPGMAGMDHAGHSAMTAVLGRYPMTREASGTAWQPDTSEHAGLMRQAGGWTLMGHGVLNLVGDHQSSRRGDDKAFVSGMVMGMAQRPIGNGTLQFRAMVSPDPLMGKSGYPLLLASGETANGRDRLIDRQHPHDFFMELSGSLSQNFSPTGSVFLYAGLPGEPAFGPPAFMHREAILDSPEAPITHHWLDSTHISFGVVTGGFVLDRVKLEVSRFNGREPDQRRWNIETGPLDSTAVRVSWNPTPELALQGSWGKFIDPEQLEPGVDQKRWSASALYARELGTDFKFAATLAWGRKSAEHHSDDAFALEASLKHRGWTLFGRGELAENRELTEGDVHGPAYQVGKVSLGTVRDFSIADHLSLGIGGLFAVNFVPNGLAPFYGERHPTGTMGFLRLKVD